MTLDTFDDESWKRLPNSNFSGTTCRGLEYALRCLNQPVPDPEAALAALKNVRFADSAAPQSLRVWSARGRAYLMLHRSARAKQAFEQALLYLTPSEDHLVRAHLRYLLGLAYHDEQEFSPAIRQLKLALRKLNTHLRTTGVDDSELRFQIFRRLASETFCLYLIEESLAYLRRAEAVANEAAWPDAKTKWERMGIVAWLYALVHQCNHAPEVGFNRAQSAVEYYRKAQIWDALSRIELVAAEIGMDWAFRQLNDRVIPDALPTIASLISDARQRIASARTQIDKPNPTAVNDKAGEALGRLADLRYRRLANLDSHEQRLTELLAAIERARLIGDAALLGQAYLVCADECVFGGGLKLAIKNYRDAIKRLDGVLPVLAIRARAALERIS